MRWVLVFLFGTLLLGACLIILALTASADDIANDITRIHNRIDKNAELILQMELEIAETKGVLKFLSWTLMAVGTVLVPVIVMFFTPLLDKKKKQGD